MNLDMLEGLLNDEDLFKVSISSLFSRSRAL